MTSELATKVQRLRAFCQAQGYQGVLLRTRPSFSWLSCGGNSTVEHGVEGGVADLLVTGAFTHSRLIQIILGGVTRHIISTTHLPVLMDH